MHKWLEEHLNQLNLVKELDFENGFTRLGYSPDEKQAHEEFYKIAQSLDLEVDQDAAGNLWAVWKAEEQAPLIAIGSHVDTVHSGGGFDGVAGVLTGLAAIKHLKDTGFSPRKNLAVVCFASEESARFGVSTIGSKAVSGLLDKNDLESITDADGTTIKEAVESFGLSWDDIDQAELSEDLLESFIELHIEQGTQIEEHTADVGIVRGIACPVRLKVTASGMANHTGTTPMNRRADAFAAAAPLINFVEEEANLINEEQEIPLVATVSTVSLSPNAMTVIPGEVELGIDIRSVDDSLKHNLAKKIKDFCKNSEEQRSGVTIKVDTLVDNASVFLDDEVQKKLIAASSELGMKHLAMDSGAGHDVMNMANKWRSGLMFIPCEKGISHHPKEYASTEDLWKGTQVLAQYLRNEAGGI
ncbi:M20 family metallo-hydrolase [Halobacillus sp. Marseille-Q1614]|uniref:M20 family metallo-hydrolase n=1 Tax=Halobacillus sp. Marseille-Q1614 TaxID=2709134 RepID=UPI00157151E7|nr:M20 family metallo-hydrolase [Halobacillus sp. Marseille-Q1614]